MGAPLSGSSKPPLMSGLGGRDEPAQGADIRGRVLSQVRPLILLADAAYNEVRLEGPLAHLTLWLCHYGPSPSRRYAGHAQRATIQNLSMGSLSATWSSARSPHRHRGNWLEGGRNPKGVSVTGFRQNGCLPSSYSCTASQLIGVNLSMRASVAEGEITCQEISRALL